MKRLRLASIALPLCMAMLVSVAVKAGPRGDAPPVEPDTPETIAARRLQMTAEMAKWLPRLVGRFNYDGVVDFNSKGFDTNPPDPLKLKTARGKADCVAIGSGPGVQCVVNVTWPEEWNADGTPVTGGVSFLGPAAILYGSDPVASTVRLLVLDTDGLVSDGAARLDGETLKWVFEGHCASNAQGGGGGSSTGCRQVTRIRAPADGKYIQMTIEIGSPTPGSDPAATFDLYMRPVPRSEGSQILKTPPQRRKH